MFLFLFSLFSFFFFFFFFLYIFLFSFIFFLFIKSLVIIKLIYVLYSRKLSGWEVCGGWGVVGDRVGDGKEGGGISRDKNFDFCSFLKKTLKNQEIVNSEISSKTLLLQTSKKLTKSPLLQTSKNRRNR